MSRILAVCTLLVLLAMTGLQPALADEAKKVALVIGNSRYQNVSYLPNPTNDAADVAAALKRLGFIVHAASDLGVSEMRKALASFADEVSDADMAVVFFAGHGVEIDKRNYLIPVDAALKSDRRVRFEAVELDDVVATLNDVKGLRVILLDACRTNPFVPKMRRTSASRAIGRGLSDVEPSEGLLIGYAAKAGTVAEDGRERNSPYTRAILSHLEEPGLEVQFLFRKVRDEVLRSTGGKQEPHTYGSLPGKQIFLAPRLEAEAPKPLPAPPVNSVTRETEALFWKSIEHTSDEREYEAFLAQFPDGTFSALARIRLNRLKTQSASLKDGRPSKTQQLLALPEQETSLARAHPRKDVTRLAPTPYARELQAELKRHGCYSGPIDGLWGAESKRALSRYNKAASAYLTGPSKSSVAGAQYVARKACRAP